MIRNVYPKSASQFWLDAWHYSASKKDRTASDAAEEAFWQDCAPDYDVKSPLASLAIELIADVIDLLNSGDEVLEIGPGTGAFTKRLYPHVSSWKGVEPSAAMRREFVRLWPAEMGRMPDLIPSKWEECNVAASDVVFTANAVYRVRDMYDCLQRLNDAAKRRVIMVQTIGRPFADPLEVKLGDEIIERERANAISDVLSEMNIEHRFRTYTVPRNEISCPVVLIDWCPAEL
ncbi:methyltransferase domain-containing protein [uncultured Cohaesibacter sp.]|uniref:class I SAM-dependent methyltransferase n=1 Tax=uncultured Cohaesibacter sp. TaxID=1002546 RepID=UPI002931DEA0|nr:methyltransferase domain-containing protein [uncultured Cohaesibacter sp.]